MQGVDDSLGRYTGTTGYVQQSIKSSDDLKENLNDRIGGMESRLSAREVALTNQYAAAQAQLNMLSYQQQQMGAIYGVVNQMY
jgi:flagellar capping protein FliD